MDVIERRRKKGDASYAKERIYIIIHESMCRRIVGTEKTVGKRGRKL